MSIPLDTHTPNLGDSCSLHDIQDGRDEPPHMHPARDIHPFSPGSTSETPPTPAYLDVFTQNQDRDSKLDEKREPYQVRAMASGLLLENRALRCRLREFQDENVRLRDQLRHSLTGFRVGQKEPRETTVDASRNAPWPFGGACDKKQWRPPRRRAQIPYLKEVSGSSLSKIVEKVATLNHGIHQAAAELGTLPLKKTPQGAAEAAIASVREMVGVRMVDLVLQERNGNWLFGPAQSHADPFLVQVLVQIFLVNYCGALVHSWSPGDPDSSSFLDLIYSRIWKSGGRAVSSQWRALTRWYTQSTTVNCQRDLTQHFSCIMEVADWVVPTSAFDVFARKCADLLEAVQDLRYALEEQMPSSDFELWVADPERCFDPGYMEDGYGDRMPWMSRLQAQALLGTTSLGLRRITIEHGEPVSENFLPAKVLLEQTLRDVLGVGLEQ